MPIETTTWGQVELGDVVRDKRDRMWWVRDANDTNELLLDNGRETVRIDRPPVDRPVEIYMPTDAEAANLVIAELGGRILKMIEEREHSITRAPTWRVEPVPARAVALRDHIDWLHGVSVDDVLRRHKGTEVNPSDKKTRAQALEDLRAAHDACHQDPDAFPMPFPHLHTLEPKETS